VAETGTPTQEQKIPVTDPKPKEAEAKVAKPRRRTAPKPKVDAEAVATQSASRPIQKNIESASNESTRSAVPRSAAAMTTKSSAQAPGTTDVKLQSKQEPPTKKPLDTASKVAPVVPIVGVQDTPSKSTVAKPKTTAFASKGASKPLKQVRTRTTQTKTNDAVAAAAKNHRQVATAGKSSETSVVNSQTSPNTKPQIKSAAQIETSATTPKPSPRIKQVRTKVAQSKTAQTTTAADVPTVASTDTPKVSRAAVQSVSNRPAPEES